MSSSYLSCWLELLRQKQLSDDSYIKMLCNDTDVFVLLVHFYVDKNMTMNVSIESPCAGITIISAKQH